MVCMGERLGAVEMFWEGSGTGTRGCQRFGTKVC